MVKIRRGRRWGVLVGLVLLATLLRGWAVLRLPTDYDEPTYLKAGFDYAEALRSGNWNAVIDYAGNREHPALVKVLYGLVIVVLGRNPDPIVASLASRVLSAVLGVAGVLVLAIADPVAGGLLAVHTMAIKYTSQVYLEAWPLLSALVAILAFVRARSARDGWFWLSALVLGATAAGKLTYLPILFPILYLALWEKHVRWNHLLLYGLAALTVFWLLDPTLWHQPIGRLVDTVFYHVGYSQGARVAAAGYPWYQPLYWISRSPPSTWHPDVFFYFALDGLIFVLALAGFYWEWRERRWVVVWIVTSILVLLLWPTKWPQYTLVLTPALCLAASTTVKHVYRWFREQELYWAWFRQMVPAPPLAFWILGAGIVVTIGVVYTTMTMEATLGRIGWSHLTANSTRLPSDTVYALLPDQDTGMILGTEGGAAIWSPPPATDMPDQWRILTTQNSGLPGNRVFAVVRDATGALWFGTDSGLARYDGSRWQTYRPADLGLPQAQVYAIALGSDGRLWAGTGSGAATFDDRSWTPYTAATSGLASDRVLSLAIQPRPDGDMVWFGTAAGVSRLDTGTGEWTSFAQDFDSDWGGVPALVLDSAGRLWAGTIGGGLGLWNGTSWQFYRTGNSDIPYNTVNTIAEVRPGVLWIGTSAPASVGGALAEFDGQVWKAYTTDNSGFSDAEPMVMARDGQQRWWIGTRTAGVDIYQMRQ
jgi:hypothetical protein